MSQDRRDVYSVNPRNLKRDFLASVVVFLVALPLCMGIAIASGVPVAAGLITGIVGGILVGFIAGTPLQVSGPAAGLVVIVYDIVSQSDLPTLGVIVLLAGLIQIAAGLLKLGQWFRAVSPAVIQGMLAGIGVLIFASQFHVMVDDTPRDSGIKNLVTIPEAIWKGLPLPEGRSEAVREAQSDLLRDVTQHRHDQVLLDGKVDQVVTTERTEAEAREQEAAIQELAPRQAALTEELAALTAELQALADRTGHEKERTSGEAALAALARSQAALDDLHEVRLDDVRGSQEAAIAALDELLSTLQSHRWAAKLGLLTILLIVGWQMFAPKKLKFIPGALVATVVVVAVAAVLVAPVIYVEVPARLWDEIHLPSLAVFRNHGLDFIIQGALVIALVASAESLLCSTAVDQMQSGPPTNYNRELTAQGVGNTICGFLGALPMTGVIVRSSANVQAGGRTRASTILHGFWLLLFVVVLGSLLSLIPTAALAAILVYTGYKLVNPQKVKELKSYGRGEVMVYGITLGMIVLTDLLIGVLTGLAFAALKLLVTFSHLRLDLKVNQSARRARLELQGAATFMRLPKIAAALDRVPEGSELHVDFAKLTYIDHACLNLLIGWAKRHEATGGSLIIDWSSLQARFNENPLAKLADDSLPSPRPGDGGARD